MIIHWSEEAMRTIRERYGADATTWKLVYDTEGCGCAVNGVPALWAVDAAEPGSAEAESNGLRLLYEPKHAIFFDERMSITYLPDANSFRLASDSQIYTTRLALSDRRSVRSL
jgi:uncharacterized protein YqkB